MIDDLVDYEEVIDGDDSQVTVGKATFIINCGPFKAGELVETLEWNYDDGRITEYHDDGEAGRTCKVKLVPAE